MDNNIRVLVAQGFDVPNFFQDIPNFVKYVQNFIKDIPNFVNDVPRKDLQSLPEGLQMKKWIMKGEIGIPLSQGLDVLIFLKDVPRVPNFVLE